VEQGTRAEAAIDIQLVLYVLDPAVIATPILEGLPQATIDAMVQTAEATCGSVPRRGWSGSME